MTRRRKNFRLHFPGLLVVLVVIITSGCASTRPDTGATRLNTPTTDVRTHSEVEMALRSKLDQWRGTPHRLGGTSLRGVDCSGLLYVWYPALFGIHLPRTTEEQVHLGSPVARADLQPGDLVFFRISRKERHVGIYLREGEFVHASSSNGVMASHLDERYWRNRYWTARRILDLSASDTPLHAAEESSEEPSHTPERRRHGW